MQITGGQTFYYRLCEARENQDRALLEALYHPDAVSLSLSTGQVTRGREAILDSFKQTFQVAGAISLRSVESLVEAGEAVCVEATLSTRFAEVQTYDIYMLQAGMAKQHVSGLISPRPQGERAPDRDGPRRKGRRFTIVCARLWMPRILPRWKACIIPMGSPVAAISLAREEKLSSIRSNRSLPIAGRFR